jgi:hypothetical protein
VTNFASEIARLLLGSASIVTGAFGLWGIVDGRLGPMALVVAIPAIACGLYTAVPRAAR